MRDLRLIQKHNKLLDIIQSDFPIVERPFREIGKNIGWSENEVITTVLSLMKDGIIL